MAKSDKDINYFYNFKDKVTNIQHYLNTMLNRTCQMFEYKGLPEEIDPIMLEKRLQRAGCLVFTKVEDNEIRKLGGNDSGDIKGGIYAFESRPAGTMDFNGNLVFATISHPRLAVNKVVSFGKDAVLLRNDTCMMGLMPIFRRYATQLVENDITMNMADIQSRITSLIVAGDSNSINSAKVFLEDVEKGSMGVISDRGFDELFQMRTLPYTTTANNSLTNLIEYQQYVKASWYNELGLDANYNMKRESINSNEAQMGQDSLLPLVDDMLRWRQKALEELNAMFGTNASVDFASGWKEIREELEAAAEEEEESEDVSDDDVESETEAKEEDDKNED